MLIRQQINCFDGDQERQGSLGMCQVGQAQVESAGSCMKAPSSRSRGQREKQEETESGHWLGQCKEGILHNAVSVVENSTEQTVLMRRHSTPGL